MQHDEHESLIRLEEQFNQMKIAMARLERTIEPLVKTSEQQNQMKSSMARMEKSIELLVTRREFSPIQRIVYGAVVIILSGVLGALLFNIGIK